jgi:hypothetical protein
MIVDMDALQTTKDRMGLLLGGEGQDNLALVAEKTDEAIGLVDLVALESAGTWAEADEDATRDIARTVIASCMG